MTKKAVVSEVVAEIAEIVEIEEIDVEVPQEEMPTSVKAIGCVHVETTILPFAVNAIPARLHAMIPLSPKAAVKCEDLQEAETIVIVHIKKWTIHYLYTLLFNAFFLVKIKISVPHIVVNWSICDISL